ncbi:hypothetical protein WJX72_008955 [[Myrmecia] bisecta]|uniref:U3 small nucleolar RNA-associated protein 13 C-terminal domain-containing protein n=1 Tax=[Myrmecia] bisecta TaxID=41462 RepID=A0AAW1PPF2_9CHLO
MNEPPTSKLTYKPRVKLEVFYTGGSVVLSRQGQLACACGDEVKVVDAANGAVLHTLPGDTEPVTALAFSPSGTHIFSASRSLLQKSWNVSTGECVRSWKGHRAPIAALAVDSTGHLLASGSADRSVRVWDVDGGYCTHAFAGHSGVVLSVLFHPKQLMLISAGDDADVRVWDLVDKSCVAVLKGHFSAVTALSLSPDGWSLLSGGRDKVAFTWDLRTHTKVATVPVYEALEAATFLPAHAGFPGTTREGVTDSKAKQCQFFATAGEKGVLKIWRSDTGRCVYEQSAEAGSNLGGQLTHVALLPGNQGLMAVTADCRLLFYQLQVQEDSKPALQLTTQLIGNNDEITDLHFIGSHDSPSHVAVSTNSEHIRLFDLERLNCTATLAGHTDIVLSLDALPLAPGRTLLASGAKDNTVRLWEAPLGRCLAAAAGHVAAVSALAFSRRGAAFLVSGGADKLLKVWDVSPFAVASTLGSGAPAELKATAAVAAHDKDINAVAISPNDALVCSGSQDRTAKVWKLPSLVLALTLRGHKRGIWAVQFSPVDQCVVTASGDKTIKLWALTDGSCLKTFEGHTASVLRCAFLSAGTQVLSTGGDGLVKLWNVRSSECIGTFDEHEDKIWALAVGGTQQSLLASGGGDATINIWEDCTEQDQATAAAQEKEAVLKQQELSNALQAEDYGAAARLAFQLKQPGRLLAVVTSTTDQGGVEAERILANLVAAFTPEELKLSLEYVREWNTNARHCHAAQVLLRALLLKHPPQTLLGIPGFGDLLAALSLYSQRHFSRIDRLMRSSFLLDYTLAAMNVLTPEREPASSAQPDAGSFDCAVGTGADCSAQARSVAPRSWAQETKDWPDGCNASAGWHLASFSKTQTQAETIDGSMLAILCCNV